MDPRGSLDEKLGKLERKTTNQFVTTTSTDLRKPITHYASAPCRRSSSASVWTNQ